MDVEYLQSRRKRSHNKYMFEYNSEHGELDSNFNGIIPKQGMDR